MRPAMFRASRHGVLFQVPQLVSASLTDHDARCSLEQHHDGDVPWRQRDRLCTSSVQTDLSESCKCKAGQQTRLLDAMAQRGLSVA